jgi:hypothetical protein
LLQRKRASLSIEPIPLKHVFPKNKGAHGRGCLAVSWLLRVVRITDTEKTSGYADRLGLRPLDPTSTIDQSSGNPVNHDAVPIAAAITAVWAAAPAVIPTTASRVGDGIAVHHVCWPSAGIGGHGKPLNNAVCKTSGVHSVIDREVAADQIGSHGGVFPGQGLGLVHRVGLVFAVVDADGTAVPRGRSVALVQRVWPAPSAA